MRLFFSEIPFKATSTEARPGDPPFNRFFFSKDADTDGPGFEDCIAHHEAVVFAHPSGEVVYELFDERLPTDGKVLCDSTNAKPVGMHPATADRLNDVKNSFAVGKHVEHRRELPNVLRKSSVPYEMAGDPEEFAQHYANHLRAFGNLNTG